MSRRVSALPRGDLEPADAGRDVRAVLLARRELTGNRGRDGGLAEPVRQPRDPPDVARVAGPAEAISSFRRVLDEHRGSVHHGEAAAMLGWLLVDAKQLAEARIRFDAATGDSSDKVRTSARAGLEALARP